MYISFTFRCVNPVCTKTEDRMVRRDEMDIQVCRDCGSDVRRLPAAPRTTFRFADKKLKD